MSGFVPSLPTLLLPPHNDFPNLCHFKFVACLRKEKRKVQWKHPPAGWTAEPSILPLCLLTYLTPRPSTLLRASHLYVVKAELWGIDKWILGTFLSCYQSHFSFISHWGWLSPRLPDFLTEKTVEVLGTRRQTFCRAFDNLWPNVVLAPSHSLLCHVFSSVPKSVRGERGKEVKNK